MNEMNCDKWFYLCLSLVGVILAGLVMVFRYFLRITRKSVELGQADRHHEEKHFQNELRIKHLEEKNGHELEKITQLEREISNLKKNNRTISEKAV